MTRLSSSIVAAFTLGFIAALMTVSGCSEPASRKLTIFQFQSTQTYTGPFQIDTSELPAGAVASINQTGNAGKPETKLTLNQDYQFEVVFRLADTQRKIQQQDSKNP